MKSLNSIIAGALAAWLSMSQPIFAEPQAVNTKAPDPIKISASVDYNSKYVFRGFTFSETPVIQTTVIANQGDVSVIGFANVDAQTRELTEADVTLEYTKPIGKNATLSLGYTYLGLPTTDFKKTQEVYAGITIENSLKPTLRVFHDFDKGKGTYTEFSLSKEFNIGSQPISVSTTLGHNDHYFREGSGFSQLELNINAPIQLGKNTTIFPKIKYSKSLCPEDFKTQLQYGVGVEFTF